MLEVPRRDWVERAACLGYPLEVFFPESGKSKLVRLAVAVCQECEVRAECLNFALQFPGPGIYGGLTENQRDALR